MVLEFKTSKLKKQCENPKVAQKDFGIQIGNKLTQRVNELKASKSLDDIAKMHMFNGFHSLSGDRGGEFAVTLVHPHRLVFTVKDKNTENLYDNIKFLRIEEVTDYQGKNKRK